MFFSPVDYFYTYFSLSIVHYCVLNMYVCVELIGILGYGIYIYSYADATQVVNVQGDGTNTVDGNSSGDIMVYGSGSQTVTDEDGNAL